MNRQMKDSGIPWIGQVPEVWTIDKFKYHLFRKELRNKRDATVLSLYRDLGIVPKASRDDNHNRTSENTSTYKWVQRGTFVVNKMKAWQGSVAVSEYEGIVSPAYYVYYFYGNEIHTRFFHFLMRTCYKDEFMRLSGGIRVDQWDLPAEGLENTLIIIPPLKEQQAIADYLDKKCAEIDELSQNIQKQIDALEQYKRSIITETVTKGLNPSAPMKDSGIPWLGKIPAHWNTIKVKFLASFINGYAFDSGTLISEGENTVIRIGDITEGSIEIETALKYHGPTMLLFPYQIMKHDILVALSGATVGKIGYINKDYPNTFINQRVGIIRSAYSRFLNYALQSSSFIPFALLYAAASAQPNISLNTIGNYTIAFPYEPTAQQAIADYLDDKCSKIDAVIKTKQKQLAKLEEYKKAVIFEYVTGKKQVPEV